MRVESFEIRMMECCNHRLFFYDLAPTHTLPSHGPQLCVLSSACVTYDMSTCNRPQASIVSPSTALIEDGVAQMTHIWHAGQCGQARGGSQHIVQHTITMPVHIRDPPVLLSVRLGCKTSYTHDTCRAHTQSSPDNTHRKDGQVCRHSSCNL